MIIDTQKNFTTYELNKNYHFLSHPFCTLKNEWIHDNGCFSGFGLLMSRVIISMAFIPLHCSDMGRPTDNLSKILFIFISNAFALFINWRNMNDSGFLETYLHSRQLQDSPGGVYIKNGSRAVMQIFSMQNSS